MDSPKSTRLPSPYGRLGPMPWPTGRTRKPPSVETRRRGLALARDAANATRRIRETQDEIGRLIGQRDAQMLAASQAGRRVEDIARNAQLGVSATREGIARARDRAGLRPKPGERRDLQPETPEAVRHAIEAGTITGTINGYRQDIAQLSYRRRHAWLQANLSGCTLDELACLALPNDDCLNFSLIDREVAKAKQEAKHEQRRAVV